MNHLTNLFMKKIETKPGCLFVGKFFGVNPIAATPWPVDSKFLEFFKSPSMYISK
jgi:hypothetical protein